MLNPFNRLLSRAFATTARTASAAGGTDNPKFYSMVLEFTESSADILENKLLEENDLALGRHEEVIKAHYEMMKKSAEQRRKTIHGIFDFMLPCKSILETNFRVRMDDDTHKVKFYFF